VARTGRGSGWLCLLAAMLVVLLARAIRLDLGARVAAGVRRGPPQSFACDAEVHARPRQGSRLVPAAHLDEAAEQIDFPNAEVGNRR
jgi:hypothetical protein